MIELRSLPAESGCLPTGVHTILHASELFAIGRANLAELGAKGAHPVVELALVREEIGGNGAERRAIVHEAKVLRAAVFAAELETVGHRRRKAFGMASTERFHASAYLAAESIARLHGKRCNQPATSSVPLAPVVAQEQRYGPCRPFSPANGQVTSSKVVLRRPGVLPDAS